MNVCVFRLFTSVCTIIWHAKIVDAVWTERMERKKITTERDCCSRVTVVRLFAGDCDDEVESRSPSAEMNALRREYVPYNAGKKHTNRKFVNNIPDWPTVAVARRRWGGPWPNNTFSIHVTAVSGLRVFVGTPNRRTRAGRQVRSLRALKHPVERVSRRKTATLVLQK